MENLKFMNFFVLIKFDALKIIFIMSKSTDL